MYLQGDDSPEQSSSPRTKEAESAAEAWLTQQAKATTDADELFYHQRLMSTVQGKDEREHQRQRDLEKRRLAVEQAKRELDEKITKMEEQKRAVAEAEKAAGSWMDRQLEEIERKKREEEEKKLREEERVKEEANAAALKWIEEQGGGNEN